MGRNIEGAADEGLLAAVRAALVMAAEPERAPAMQSYMKSAMPCLGVPKPARERALRPVLAARVLPGASAWPATVLALWRRARFREERYAAIDLARHRAYLAYQRAEALGLYDEMITAGAWWDYVDEVAAHRAGPLLAARPEVIRPVILRWSCDGNLWRRRSSIICQLTFKAATDLGLLYACIDASLDEDDFFIRKAIGWALRQYARTDPAEVGRFVSARGDRLSRLSRREALKNIGQRPSGPGMPGRPRSQPGPVGTELTLRPTAAKRARRAPEPGFCADVMPGLTSGSADERTGALAE